MSWKPGVWLTARSSSARGATSSTPGDEPARRDQPALPLFGIANQLLAAVALTVVTTILIKSGRLKWAWVTAIPLAWDAVVTLTASYEKVFSDNPKLGFFAQRDKFQDAIDKGQVVPPAKSLDDMQQVVTNSTVDGILAALFAVMIIVVLLDASRVWLRSSWAGACCRPPRRSSSSPSCRARRPVPDGARARRPRGGDGR